MDAQFKQDLKTKIKSLIEKFSAELEKLAEDTQPIAPENSLGRISRMDAINNKSVIEAAYRTKKKKLASLRVALSKIDQERFGNCGNCGHEIQEGRLLFMPESDLCIRCASRN